MTTGYASVILDVDSTLCGIEGIDWLAERQGRMVGRQVTDLTGRAMHGEITLDEVYGERLALVRPGRDDVDALAHAYAGSLAPGATQAIQRLHAAERRVVLVSGGIREAIVPLARLCGIAEQDVHAVSLRFDADGAYGGFDTGSPLSIAAGKRTIASSLALPSRVLAMGDGATDLAMRPVVAAFAAFIGFVSRESVVAAADYVLESFDQLVELVLA
jgi:phosphoserine phosphatase